MAAGPTKAWAVRVHEAKQQSPASRRILPLPRGMLEVCWGRGGVVLVDAVVMVEMAGGACFGFGFARVLERVACGEGGLDFLDCGNYPN